jgi:hypothetical protein
MASVSKNLKSLPITTKWRFDKRNLLCDVISTKNIYIKRIVVRLCAKESSFWRKKCNVLLSIVNIAGYIVVGYRCLTSHSTIVQLYWCKKNRRKPICQCNVLLSIVQLFNNKKYFWHLLLFFIQGLPHNLAVIWGSSW